MSDHSEQTTAPGLGEAMQAHLDGAGVDEDGNGLRVAGYAAVIVYLRPDGTSGLTVLAPYDTPELVADLLDKAHELVVTGGRTPPYAEG